MKRKIYITRMRRKLDRITDHITGKMRRKGITQTQMGDRLGISQQVFSKRLKTGKLYLEDFLEIIDALEDEREEVIKLICDD